MHFSRLVRSQLIVWAVGVRAARRVCFARNPSTLRSLGDISLGSSRLASSFALLMVPLEVWLERARSELRLQLFLLE